MQHGTAAHSGAQHSRRLESDCETCCCSRVAADAADRGLVGTWSAAVQGGREGLWVLRGGDELSEERGGRLAAGLPLIRVFGV